VSAVLVDTHIALWALGDPTRLTDDERALLQDPAVAAGFRMLQVNARLLEAAADLPRHHADPVDRVLVSQALEEDLSVLTRDPAFAGYGVRLAAATR
jgi:PIN domain nuclease of toxin-antitoxin system